MSINIKLEKPVQKSSLMSLNRTKELDKIKIKRNNPFL